MYLLHFDADEFETFIVELPWNKKVTIAANKILIPHLVTEQGLPNSRKRENFYFIYIYIY